MPVGQAVAVLPSLKDAVYNGLSVPPPVPRPVGWTFSLAPDLNDWQPGDIVLVEKRGVKGALIAAAQWTILPAATSSTRWSHCAIYVGGGEIVDAMPGKDIGVRQRKFADYCFDRATALLRLDVGGKLLDPLLGQLISAEAKRLVGQPYAISALARVAGRFLAKAFGVGQQPVPRQAKKLYCSSLVVVAYKAININLDFDPNVLPCLPSNLPTHQDLYSLPLDWHVVI
jgi:cell wall-associated NlpC family hydrolase